ncbi:MAG: hypothetical protein WBG48_10795 [Pricia sp.]
MKILKIIFATFLLVTLTACPGSNDDSPLGGGGDPGSVALVFPENNKECTEGRIGSDTQSTITFQWEARSGVDSYEVNVKNLAAGTSIKTEVNTNEADISLLRGVPYEWFVTSKKEGSQETANSETWRFYNQGVGTQSYAPFPAEAVSPLRGASIVAATTLNLQWIASDVDGDITEYEVLFGTEATPTVSLGTATEATIPVTIASGRTYYWRVITKDGLGNTSRSEIFNFSIQ